ncbi:uncharacterized protein LOC111635641 [Centruroides sculpturatus]|uniref:uncharacterized protein LOC111635641 n=1 Tax=Centruroides sculpturatus TaxID=218467 RepID=UPI000C6E43D0|nr:uncharacterized protein LOC111635641 [Centruroides sculpturatus]
MKTITLYYQRYRCEKYIPRPRLCDRCFFFGYLAASCRGRRRCIRCGADHEPNESNAERKDCICCGGEHKADSPQCEAYQREARLCVTHKCSYQEAKRLSKCKKVTYATVTSTHKPTKPEEAYRRPTRGGEKLVRGPPALTDDVSSLTSRIALLESTVEALRVEIRSLNKKLQSRQTVPDQVTQTLECEQNMDIMPTVSTPSKRASNYAEPTAAEQQAKKKEGTKLRHAAAQDISDTEDPPFDTDLFQITNASRAISLEDLSFTTPAEQVKIRKRQPKNHPPHV